MKLYQLINETQELQWADSSFGKKFDAGDFGDAIIFEVELEQKFVMEPENAGYKQVGYMTSPRAGSIDMEVWIAPNKHIALREVLTGDNDDRMMILKWKENELNNVLVTKD